MATINKGYTFGATEQVTNTKLHTLLDSATLGSIINNDIDASAGIVDTKLAQLVTADKVANTALSTITTYGKVTGAALSNLGSLATLAGTIDLYGSISGKAIAYLGSLATTAGVIPDANLGSAASVVVQVVNTQTGELITGTTTFPADDTIPQITEGNEALSVAITPKATANKLKIDVTVHFTTPSDSGGMAALFRAGTANALACMQRYSAAGSPSFISFSHYVEAGSTSALTFSVRVGQAGAGTISINGQGGSRTFGGVLATSMTITEIKA